MKRHYLSLNQVKAITLLKGLKSKNSISIFEYCPSKCPECGGKHSLKHINYHIENSCLWAKNTCINCSYVDPSFHVVTLIDKINN